MSDKPPLTKNSPSPSARSAKQDVEQSQKLTEASKDVTLPISPIDARDVALLAGSHLFDVTYYRQQIRRQSSPRNGQADTNILLSASNLELIEHYLRFGFHEGCKPNPIFDSVWYLAQNPDVLAAGVNPLVHYVVNGAKEGRRPSAEFDAVWYLQNYKDAAVSGLNALEHYLLCGESENRSINRDDYRRTLESEPDLSASRRVLEQRSLPVVACPPAQRRVNLVMDYAVDTADGAGKLAIAIAAMLATESNAGLRIVTRMKRSSESSVAQVLLARNLPIPRKVEFVFCDYVDESAELAICQSDFFMALGFNNTVSVRKSIADNKIVSIRVESSSAPVEGDSEIKSIVLSPTACVEGAFDDAIVSELARSFASVCI